MEPSHRSGRQHVRQGNDYQNPTASKAGHMMNGDVHAQIFSMNYPDQSHRPQKTEQEKKEDPWTPLRFSRPSSTVPLNTQDVYSFESVIDPRLLLPAEPFLDTHPQDETATQAQVDEPVRQRFVQAPIRDDSASAGHSADRATSQYFAKQNDKYTMTTMAHQEWVQQSAPPPQFLRDSRSLPPRSGAAAARPFGCEEPGCTKRFENRAYLRYVLSKSEPSASGILIML
jgi:hypothetical protein